MIFGEPLTGSFHGWTRSSKATQYSPGLPALEAPNKPQEPQELEQTQHREATPELKRENSWNFFVNPHSDWEERQRRSLEEYKRSVQQEMKELYARKERGRRSRLVEKPRRPDRSFSEKDTSFSPPTVKLDPVRGFESPQKPKLIQDQV